MDKQTTLDAGKVADLAKQVAEQQKAVDRCQKAKDEASSDFHSADAALANLRRELTRALDGHLDMSTLKQRPPTMHRVPEEPAP